MSSIRNTRALRLSLIAFLVCGAFTLSARTAHAQFWSEPVCMETGSIPGLFTGMDFSGAPKCESLCKYTANQCKAFSKSAASCTQTDAKGYWTLLAKIECDTQALAADRKACNSEVNGIKKDAKASINSDRDLAIAQCEVLLNQCLQGCAMPVL